MKTGKVPKPVVTPQLALAGTKVYDGPTRFMVPSSKPGEQPYLVELETYGLVGKCTCPHFTARLEPELVAGTRGPALRCKHINIARCQYALNGGHKTDEEVDQSLRTYANAQKTAQADSNP